MNLEKEIRERSDETCELCGSSETLSIYTIDEFPGEIKEASFMICSICKEQLEDQEKIEPNHWRCLNDSMWSTIPSIQVTAWHMLNRLQAEGWPQDLLDIMYMEDELKAFAEKTLQGEETSDADSHHDSNGTVLEVGDTVVLIKDLNVKGSSLTAKRGTAVRRISLVQDNPGQIEGKVEGQQIVILTKFVKKV